MRTLLHEKTSGRLGRYEDWWYLEIDETGVRQVMHKWDHVSVRSGSKSEGEKVVSVPPGRTVTITRSTS